MFTSLRYSGRTQKDQNSFKGFSKMGSERRSMSMNDREEIRRRLAAESESESESSKKEKYTINSNLNRKLHASGDLKLCFLNEPSTALTVEGIHGLEKMRNDAFNQMHQDNGAISEIQQLNNRVEKIEITSKKCGDLMVNMRKNKMERFRNILNSARPNGKFPSDFHRYHSLIVAEAKSALARAKEMAKNQMQTEREKYKQSSIAHLIEIPFEKDTKLSRNVLGQMSIPKLQLLVNDLHGRIKSLNEELVLILQQRDELHMEQDSILVDIEDATIFLLRRLRHQQAINT